MELLGQPLAARMYLGSTAAGFARLLLTRPSTIQERFDALCERAFEGNRAMAAARVEHSPGLLAKPVNRLKGMRLSSLKEAGNHVSKGRRRRHSRDDSGG